MDFYQRVLQLIRKVPKGKVATYALIARSAGKAKGARAVGWFLHSSTHKYKLPWHRIIKSDGSLSFTKNSPQFIEQKSLLVKEGVVFNNDNVDVEKFLWTSLML